MSIYECTSRSGESVYSSASACSSAIRLSLAQAIVDALLLCFCEDIEANNGSDGREYYMNIKLFVRTNVRSLTRILLFTRSLYRSRDFRLVRSSKFT